MPSKKLLLLSFIVLLSVVNIMGQNKVLFRYSADLLTGSNLLTPVTLNSVTVSDNVEAEDVTARASGGWGFAARKAAYLSGASSSIISSSNVQTSFWGEIALSGELWVKPILANGVLLSWDDTSKANGFNVYLENSKITVRSRLAGKNYDAVSENGVTLSQWQYINWLISRKNNQLEVTVYVNNKKELYQKIATDEAAGLVSLSTPVMLGYSANSGLPVQRLNGYIHAANMKNYLSDDAYISAFIPFDGGAYFGIPNYHDYTFGTLDNPVDKRVTVSKTPISKTAFIPYQNEGYMAQGITNTNEDEKYIGDEFIYISMYHKTVTGQTGLRRSLLVEIDPQNNFKVRRCFRLMGTLGYSHVGGIAFRNNSIYVSSGSKIEIYPIPEYKAPYDKKYLDLTTTSSNVFAVASVASFCSYYNDTLWIGDYQVSSAGINPYLYGYRVDAAGKVINNETPAYFRLPFNTQGIAWKKFGGERYLFISQSGGDAGSKVHRVRYSALKTNAIPAFDTTFQVPAGGEDLSFDKNGDLLNVSESGSLYMQKGDSPYTSFFPFVFIINDSVLFANKITSVNDKQNSSGSVIPSGFNLKAYPNPFNCSARVSVCSNETKYASVKIFNLLGQEVETLFTGIIKKGENIFNWDAKHEASGTFFLAVVADGALKANCKLILLK